MEVFSGLGNQLLPIITMRQAGSRPMDNEVDLSPSPVKDHVQVQLPQSRSVAYQNHHIGWRAAQIRFVLGRGAIQQDGQAGSVWLMVQNQKERTGCKNATPSLNRRRGIFCSVYWL